MQPHGVDVQFQPTDQTNQPEPENRPNSLIGLNLPSIWEKEARIEWLIDGIIPLEAVTLLSAESGTGKTWLAYAIAGAVAHGTDFLGRKTKCRPVLYMDGENPLAVVKRNIQELGIERTDNLHIWGGWNYADRGVPVGPDDQELFDVIRAEKPLIIWDPLIEFNREDEQDATKVRRFMNHFRRLMAAGATQIVLHNTGKAETSKEYRGSSDIKAAVDMAYTLIGAPRNGALHQLTMRCFKSRLAPGRNVGLEFVSGEGFRGMDVPQPEQAVSVDEIVLAIIGQQPGLNRDQIWTQARAMGVSRKNVFAFLDTLPHANRGGRGKLYFPEDIPALRESVAAV